MEHIAFLSKKLDLLNKIISREKTIESRWYVNKKPPYNSISINDVIYFKNSGEPVSVKTKVENVIFYNNLNEEKIRKIISQYGKEICIDMDYLINIKEKRLCTLIFLKDVKKIEPFEINKKGYGNMCAWISIDDVQKIKL